MLTYITDISDNEQLYYGHITDATFKIWEQNRKIDNSRVTELKTLYIKNNNKVVPGIIYTFIKNDSYIIYDGTHRYKASKNLDMFVLVSVIKEYTAELINESFLNVNKSIPVPDCYFNDKNNKKKLCEKIVEYINDKYNTFKSSSLRPIRPNYNQDVLMDDIFIALDKNKNKDLCYDDIVSHLEFLNKSMKKTVIGNGLNYWKKSIKYDFWIFYMSREQFIEELNKL